MLGSWFPFIHNRDTWRPQKGRGTEKQPGAAQRREQLRYVCMYVRYVRCVKTPYVDWGFPDGNNWQPSEFCVVSQPACPLGLWYQNECNGVENSSSSSLFPPPLLAKTRWIPPHLRKRKLIKRTSPQIRPNKQTELCPLNRPPLIASLASRPITRSLVLPIDADVIV